MQLILLLQNTSEIQSKILNEFHNKKIPKRKYKNPWISKPKGGSNLKKIICKLHAEN